MSSVVFPRQAKPAPVEFAAAWMDPLGKQHPNKPSEPRGGSSLARDGGGRETREKMRGGKRRKGGRKRWDKSKIRWSGEIKGELLSGRAELWWDVAMIFRMWERSFPVVFYCSGRMDVLKSNQSSMIRVWQQMRNYNLHKRNVSEITLSFQDAVQEFLFGLRFAWTDWKSKTLCAF